MLKLSRYSGANFKFKKKMETKMYSQIIYTI